MSETYRSRDELVTSQYTTEYKQKRAENVGKSRKSWKSLRDGGKKIVFRQSWLACGGGLAHYWTLCGKCRLMISSVFLGKSRPITVKLERISDTKAPVIDAKAYLNLIQHLILIVNVN